MIARGFVVHLVIFASFATNDVKATGGDCPSRLVSEAGNIMSDFVTEKTRLGLESLGDCHFTPDLSKFTVSQLHKLYEILRTTAGGDVMKFYAAAHVLLFALTNGKHASFPKIEGIDLARSCEQGENQDILVRTYMVERGTLSGATITIAGPNFLGILITASECWSKNDRALFTIDESNGNFVINPKPQHAPPKPAKVLRAPDHETDGTLEHSRGLSEGSVELSPAIPRQIVDQTFRSLSIVNEENIFGSNLATVVYNVTALNYQAVDVAVMARVLDSYIMVLIKALDQLEKLSNEEKRINARLEDVLLAIAGEIGFSD
jgi:hypothetical protein